MFLALRSKLASALRQPQEDLIGWWVANVLLRKNYYLEQAAVKLCKIDPDHRVLEVGFGPGIGLEAAYDIVQAGRGKVYGVDISSYMVERAVRRLAPGVVAGKIELHNANAIQLPFLDSHFDRIFHCNCFYFWPRQEVVAKELFRVMKEGGFMVTTLSMESLRAAKSRGLLPNTCTDPLNYMTSLENVGFREVGIEYFQWKGRDYQAIFAEKQKLEKAELSQKRISPTINIIE